MPLTSTRSAAVWAETSIDAARSNAKAMNPARNMEFPLYVWCVLRITDTTNDFPTIRHRRRNYSNPVQVGSYTAGFIGSILEPPILSKAGPLLEGSSRAASPSRKQRHQISRLRSGHKTSLLSAFPF